MTDLEFILATATPRDDAKCRRLAARIDRIWGFVAYGFLWFFVTCMTATAFIFLAIVLVGKLGPPWAGYIFTTAWTAGFLLPWLPFGIWVSRRRGAARRLFREGVVLEGTVIRVDFITFRGAPLTRASVTFTAGGATRSAAMSAGGHLREIVAGAKTPVLFEPHYKYCAVFPIGGAALPAAY